MGFWTKSVRIFKSLCENANQSIRQLARQTGISKSSVHRLKQAMERRDRSPESWLWETEDGRRWLTRLVVATLYTFGLKRGVGLETISEFFTHLHLDDAGGMFALGLAQGDGTCWRPRSLETAAAWEQEGVAAGEMREIIGAVDETFLQRMMLVFMDLVSGYLLFEEVAEDRTYDTWYALVEARLETLGTDVLYLVSDRAKALIKLAETGLGCLSIPDVFHLIHDLVKSYSLGDSGASETRPSGLAPSARAPPHVPGVRSQRCGSPAGAGRGGGACSAGAALGNGGQRLSAAP